MFNELDRFLNKNIIVLPIMGKAYPNLIGDPISVLNAAFDDLAKNETEDMFMQYMNSTIRIVVTHTLNAQPYH